MIDISSMNIHDLYELRLRLNELIQIIEEEACTSLLLGVDYPSFALKPGRNTRSIPNEDEVVEMCVSLGIPRDELVVPKFKGIPNMEKLIKPLSKIEQEQIMANVVTTPGKASVTYLGRPE